MKFGDVESHQSPVCLTAGVQGSNCGWGCSIRGGSLTYCDKEVLKILKKIGILNTKLYGLAIRPLLVKCYDNKKVKSPG